MTHRPTWLPDDATLRQWVGAMVFGGLAYVSITAFSHHRDDNVQRVVAKVFSAAATLMAIALLSGVERPRPSARAWWLLGGVVASMVVSTLWAPRGTIAWDRLQLYYALALWALSVFMLHRGDDRPAAVPYLVAIAVVHALVLIEVVFWLIQARGGADPLLAQRMPYHANVRHFSYLGYLAAASALALSMLSQRLAFTGLLLCTAALFGIVQLGSRGGLLGWITFLLAAFALSRERRRLVALGIGATIMAIGTSWLLSELHLLNSDSLIARGQHGDLAGATGRLSLWADVLRAIMVRPWWGYGPDGHRVLDCCGAYGPYIARTVQPHNVILQLLEEFGSIGTILIGALVVRLAAERPGPRGWRALARAHRDVAMLLAILAGLLAYGLVDGPFYYPVPLFIATALAALLLSAARRTARSAEP